MTRTDATRKDAASVGRRDDLLQALRTSHEPRTINELADELGIHPNTVRFHLDTLIDTGRVERVDDTDARPDRRTTGRPAQLFRAVRAMDPAGPRNYAMLAEALLHALGTGEEARDRALQAGRVWGHSALPTDTAHPAPDEGVGLLVDMLHEQGFAPDRPDSVLPATIGLHHCPFLELAQEQTDTVCAVHLGMMQGATAHSTVTVDSVDPFAEPDRCVAHLSQR